VANVALPLLSVAVPRATPFFSKVTVPVGIPTPELTVAVNVTGCPKLDGLTDEATTVAVAALFTVWLSTAEVLVAYISSPSYTALMESVPTGSAAVL
jgi:hypothetical protein